MELTHSIKHPQVLVRDFSPEREMCADRCKIAIGEIALSPVQRRDIPPNYNGGSIGNYAPALVGFLRLKYPQSDN